MVDATMIPGISWPMQSESADERAGIGRIGWVKPYMS